MSRWNLAWLLGVPAVVILGLTLSYSAPRPPRKEQDYQLLELVADVLAEVDQNYVRELSPEQKKKMVEDMINGGLDKLDPYSSYFNEQEYKLFEQQSEGSFGGVGIQVGIDRTTNVLMVISPMVGTPAYEGGVLAGDLILKVNGKSTEGMRISDAIPLIQGEPGTEVTLTVKHDGSNELQDITLTRAKIEHPSVLSDAHKADKPSEWDYMYDKANRIGYVRLVAFNEHSSKDLEKAIAELERDGARGLVLDLRDNPGGLLKSAVEISDLFLAGGRIVSTKDRNGRGQAYDAVSPGTMMEPAAAHPMVVLVNKNSASASEIVAAALQDNGRATIVGERSFGKGSVQNIIVLPDRNPKVALKLTTAGYQRPNGHNIHRMPDAKETDEWGVKPNPGFEVKLKDEERLQYLIWRRQRDIVQGKTNAPPKPKAEDPNKPEKPFSDKVLDKALEHLRAELQKNG